MKVKIIDYIGNSFNYIPIGHPKKVIEQFQEILSDDFEIALVLPDIYQDTFMIDLIVPFYHKIENNQGLLQKIHSSFGKLVNIAYVFGTSKNELLFFINVDIILFISLIFVKKRNKIAIVNYTNYDNDNNKNHIKKFIYKLVKNKILIEFSTFNFGDDNFIPDYYYSPIDEKSLALQTVDLLVIGTINEAKDVIGLINSVLKSNLSLKIIGKFYNENYYQKVLSYAYDQPNIIIVNKYLTDEEYKLEILGTRYVALPYQKDVYNSLTSGVFLDALYGCKPIICPKTPFFEQFVDLDVGIIYDNIDDIESLIKVHNYNESLVNILNLQNIYSKSKIKEKVVTSILRKLEKI